MLATARPRALGPGEVIVMLQGDADDSVAGGEVRVLLKHVVLLGAGLGMLVACD